MKSIRRIHAWLGVLFAPSILLFSLSGIFQITGSHEGEGGDEPASWIVRIAQIHMHQTASLPRKRAPRPPASVAPATTTPASTPPVTTAPATTTPATTTPASTPPATTTPATTTPATTAAATAPAGPSPEGRGTGNKPTTGPLKAFFVLMSLGLIASTFLGLYIAFTSKRDRGLHVGLLVAGFVIPIVMMLL